MQQSDQSSGLPLPHWMRRTEQNCWPVAYLGDPRAVGLHQVLSQITAYYIGCRRRRASEVRKTSLYHLRINDRFWSGQVSLFDFSSPFYSSATALQLLLHPFNGLFSRTAWVSRYQKGKTSLDLNEARDGGVLRWQTGSGISWAICTQSVPRSRQITTPTPHRSVFTGRMLFLTPNQQRQSTEGMHVLRECYRR